MSDGIFSDCRIVILPYGLPHKRISLFERQVRTNGGQIIDNVGDVSPTHVVIQDDLLLDSRNVDKVLKTLSISTKESHHVVVGTRWLSNCIKKKSLQNVDEYSFKDELSNTPHLKNDQEFITPVKIRKIESVDDCMHSNDYSCGTESLQVHERNDIKSVIRNVIDELQKLADSYQSRGDRWRLLAYRKAIASIKSNHSRITSLRDLKSLPNISAKVFDKIKEIDEEGSLSKVQEVCNDEKTKTLQLFSQVWGAGPVTVQLWYQKGFRTLEDLRNYDQLTDLQRVGLKYFDEIREPIPRTEVERIVNVVREVVDQLKLTARVMPCGSYRRGQQMCGDVDILLIVNDSTNYCSILPKIICELRSKHFLVDDLIKTVSSNKYLGLCKLSEENSKVRRIDIFVASEEDFAPAILHYTGNDLFNRGIRLHASRMGMHLSQSGLTVSGSKVKLSTPTEKAIFEHLKLEYRPPEDRYVF